MYICRKLIKVTTTHQPNRILIHKPLGLRIVIPEEVVMQPGLFIEVLVLQSERLVQVLVYPLILFQITPAGVVTEPQQIAVHVGPLSWDADLVAVEVVGLLAVFAVFVDAVSIRETAYIRAAHDLRQDWKFYVCYGLLYISH